MSVIPFDDVEVDVAAAAAGFFLICLSTIGCLVMSLTGTMLFMPIEAEAEAAAAAAVDYIFFSDSSLLRLVIPFSH